MNTTLGRLTGRIAIVTGASRSTGIGAAVCKELAYPGADVFLHTGLVTINRCPGVAITRSKSNFVRKYVPWAFVANT